MPNVWTMGAVAVVGVLVGVGLDRYIVPKPPPPNSHRYSFRVNLVDKHPGSPMFEQPTEIELPTGFDDRNHDVDRSMQPPGTVQTIQVILGSPVAHQHPPPKPGSGGGDAGPHCHGWAFIQGAWRQVHCGY